MANELGTLRRSSVVMTFGPGAVVDFRAGGAPVSGVAAGLDEWDAHYPQAGRYEQAIHEPRLQYKLGVRRFRLPPVRYETWPPGQTEDNRALMAARFPQWLQCPDCDRIAPAGKWTRIPGGAARHCAKCTRKAPGERKVYVVPTRFVMACPKGHLDEFPWHAWVSHRQDCAKKEKADLYLRAEGAGLAGLVLNCGACGARSSMDGIFGRETWRDSACRGRRPWLAVHDEPCDEDQRAMQRGASNIYFPVMASALTIPPWTDPLLEALAPYWNRIVEEANPETRTAYIHILAEDALAHILAGLDGIDTLVQLVEDRVAAHGRLETRDIRRDEYQQFDTGTQVRDREFETRNVGIPERLKPFLGRIVRVVRLREVRALRSFTRIIPPGSEDSPYYAPITAQPRDWLPAIEVRGEGIFLALNAETVSRWEARDTVQRRARDVDRSWRAEWAERYEDEPERPITPRFLLLHTFAHALIRQLTLESGYSTASLRERLYVCDGADGMTGLLIYTATPDADGTLGGLQRQGKAERLERTVVAAIQAMEWCSSDPLCIEGMVSDARRLSPAACHACVMAPETACEEFNRFLDRSSLVGLPGEADVGFFSALLAD